MGMSDMKSRTTVKATKQSKQSIARSRRASGPFALEPALLALQVTHDKLFVRFGEIYYSFDDPDYAGHDRKDAAGQDRYEKHDDPLGRVAQHELVNTESPNHYPQDSSQDLFVSSHRLPISHCSWRSLVYRLHWLITSTNGS